MGLAVNLHRCASEQVGAVQYSETAASFARSIGGLAMLFLWTLLAMFPSWNRPTGRSDDSGLDGEYCRRVTGA